MTILPQCLDIMDRVSECWIESVGLSTSVTDVLAFAPADTGTTTASPKLGMTTTNPLDICIAVSNATMCLVMLRGDSRPSGSSDWLTGCWLLHSLRLLFRYIFSRSFKRVLLLSSPNCTGVTLLTSCWFNFHLVIDLTLKICLIWAACHYCSMGHWSFLWFPSCIIAEQRLVYRVIEHVWKCFQCTRRLCISSIVIRGTCSSRLFTRRLWPSIISTTGSGLALGFTNFTKWSNHLLNMQYLIAITMDLWNCAALLQNHIFLSISKTHLVLLLTIGWHCIAFYVLMCCYEPTHSFTQNQ